VREETVFCSGKSGREYKYWVYPLGSPFEAVPGNYCFVKEAKPQDYQPVYFGESKDLSERFDSHHKMRCLKENGVTHIHAHKSRDDKQVRLTEAADLVSKWHPPCND